MSRDSSWDQRLGAWFDGEASELDAAEVRAHLMEDRAARARVQEWKELREDLALLQPQAPAPEVLARMQHRFEEGLGREVYLMAQSLRWWNLAAAMLLVLGLSWWAVDYLRPQQDHDAYASEPGELDQAIQEFLNRPPRRPQ